jgi:Na+-driven multidrug efflux pump
MSGFHHLKEILKVLLRFEVLLDSILITLYSSHRTISSESYGRAKYSRSSSILHWFGSLILIISSVVLGLLILPQGDIIDGKTYQRDYVGIKAPLFELLKHVLRMIIALLFFDNHSHGIQMRVICAHKYGLFWDL